MTKQPVDPKAVKAIKRLKAAGHKYWSGNEGRQRPGLKLSTYFRKRPG